MAILTKESNKAAFRAVQKALDETGRATLVRPAGTGKGRIVWELLDAEPEQKVIWVTSCAARTAMRRTLAEKLGRTLDADRVRLTDCKQLAAEDAAGWVALAAFRPGLILLDGWREMDAGEWTGCIEPLLRLCPDAKILALAEPDAPGSRCRAAAELLEPATVEPLSLGGALAAGLLPQPTSYTALLWPQDAAMAQLRAEVKNLHVPSVPDANEEKYKALCEAVQKLPPVQQLLADWMPDSAGRYLVLCEDAETMQAVFREAGVLFGEGVRPYSAEGDCPARSKGAAEFAADETETVRLLLCVDMPGVQESASGLSGVVLVRRTAEPSVYRQMMARALAACGSLPMVELSSSFEALTCVQKLRQECSAAGAEPFALNEPLAASRRAYRHLRRSLDTEWERYFNVTKKLAAGGQTLDVPRNWRAPDGMLVGRWLENQRMVRAGKKNGRLTAEQIARLDKLGMNWKQRLEMAWEKGYTSAKRYRDTHADLLVPVHYKDKDGFALGEWIVYNRQRYVNNSLPAERIARLEALGMVWDTSALLWDKSYAAAVQFYLQDGTLEIPVKYVTPDGMALGVWLGSQRAAYKDGTLSEEQIARLEALGVDWTNRNDRKWQTAYEAAVRYYKVHGDLNVPSEYVDEDGILLGKWVSRQRYAWQNPTRSSARVTPERKALLDELGMNWEKTDSWQHRYELAMEYKNTHGGLAIPAQYRTGDGVWLGSWLSRQHQLLRDDKKLTPERRKALKELFKGEKDRRTLAPVQPSCSVREQNWLDNYERAKVYFKNKGDLLVPAGYVDETKFRLGVWISNLRAARKTRPDSFQITPEHIAMLDAIGMQWDAREAKWLCAYRRAEQYRTEHGDLLVPVNYKTEDGFCLGDWVRRMRESGVGPEKKLSAEHIGKLDALGMVWNLPEN